MNWLLFSYWIMAGTLAQDMTIYMPGSTMASYITPANSFEVTLGAEFLFMDHFFADGSVETFEEPSGAFLFSPFQSNYRFGFGIRWKGFEIGWRHECDHITLSTNPLTTTENGMDGTKTEIYMSFKGSIKIF